MFTKLNVPVECLINVTNKQLTVNDLSTFIKGFKNCNSSNNYCILYNKRK